MRAEYVAFWNLGIVAVALGRFDEATCYLEQALEAREPSLYLLKSFPWFEPISRSSRFNTILAGVAPAKVDGIINLASYDFVQVSLTFTTRPFVSVNDVVIVLFVSLTFVKTSGAKDAMSGALVWMTYV